MTSQLDQLRELSAVVADTGDIDAIARFRPLDATTNPSLLLKAAVPAHAALLDRVKLERLLEARMLERRGLAPA